MVHRLNTLLLLVSLDTFRGRGSRSLTRLEDRRVREAGGMLASTESLNKADTGRRRKIRFNPYNEFSD